MLSIVKIGKSFGGRVLLADVSFNLNNNRRIGLVGPNGAGKSTLLKIICGLLEPDSGLVQAHGVFRPAFLPQSPAVDEQAEVASVLNERLWRSYQRLIGLEADVGDTAAPEIAAGSEYVEAFSHFDDAGGYKSLGLLEQKLERVGLSHVSMDRSFGSLSGGEQTRLMLATAFGSEPTFLLLDEPTNNLDSNSIEWLEEALKRLPCGYLIASHDRRFLDRTTEDTFEIDSLKGTVTEYGGSYSVYRQTKDADERREWREYQEQQRRVRQLESDIRATKAQALSTELTTVHDFFRGIAKGVAAKAKARESRLERMLSEEQKREAPIRPEQMHFTFSNCALHDKLLFEAKELCLERDGACIISGADFSLKGTARVAVTGKNGSGKSTFLQALAGNLSPFSGQLYRNPSLQIGYMAQTTEQLPLSARLFDYFIDKIHESLSRVPENVRLLETGAARTFLSHFLFRGDQVFCPIGALSRGEQCKLHFACLMACRCEVLILDEPTNHMDIPSLECLQGALKSFSGAFVIVSHDREFVDQIAPTEYWHLCDRELITDPLAL